MLRIPLGVTNTHAVVFTPKAHQQLSVGPRHGEWLLKSQTCLLLLSVESIGLENCYVENSVLFLFYLINLFIYFAIPP